MKTRTIQISQSDLINSQSTPIEIDISMTWTRSIFLSRWMLPRQIRIENYSGVNVYFTLLKDSDELTEYHEGLPYYSLVPIVNQNVMVNANNGLDSVLIVQADPGASSSLITTGITFYGLFYQ